MTVALATRSTGSPDLGSKICEYQRPLIRKPRWELPLVATDLSLIPMYVNGSVDSESANGEAIPTIPLISPRAHRSPPTFRRRP